MIDVYTIYKNPKDYPGKYVLRRWETKTGEPIPDQEPIAVSEELAEVRAALPQGLVEIPVQEGDDPCIFETWV